MAILKLTIRPKIDGVFPVSLVLTDAGPAPLEDMGELQLDKEEKSSLLEYEADPRQYGVALGKLLFKDRVKDAFLKNRRQLRRIQLVIEDDELKTLRWERLCAPIDGDWVFLGRSQGLFYSQYIPSPAIHAFPDIGSRDLRALVVVANPPRDNRYGLQAFDAATALNSVQQSLGNLPHDVLALAEGAVGPPTLDMLINQLTKERYAILHLVAHGAVPKDGPRLYLLDDKGQIDGVNGDRLLNRLRDLNLGLPRFVYLSACETGSPRAETDQARGSLARRLIKEAGILAVVAMTDRISVDTANKIARTFYVHLRKNGMLDQALVKAGVGLTESDDITVPALFTRLEGRPLFSDDADRDLTALEIEYGLKELAGRLRERAPCLEDALADPAKQISEMRDTDLDHLVADRRREYDQALAEVDRLCEEALDFNYRALALGKTPPKYNATCPFLGLEPFDREHRRFFFGRTELVEDCLRQLKQHPFLAILGASGSGKSSLIRAGLLPALEERFTTYYMTPGDNPNKALNHELHAMVEQAPTILVVDHFEELFTHCPDPDVRRLFAEQLLALPEEQRERGLDLKIVISMRLDFLSDCVQLHTLYQAIRSHEQVVRPLDFTALRSAMERQAETVGLRFEADLGHAIIEEAGKEPGSMPLLQHLLLELWRRRHGRWLRADEYRFLGGVQGALNQVADRFFDQLKSNEARALVRNIFIRLTRLDEPSKDRVDVRYTRRRVALDELVPVATPRKVVRDLVERLANERLIVTGTNKATGAREVEVAHEALIRHWSRLGEWLEEDRKALLILADINSSAQKWDDRDRSDDFLMRWNENLEEADILFRQPRHGQNELERDFLAACKGLRDREAAHERHIQRRLKIFAGIISGVAVVAILAMVASLHLFKKANEAAELARTNEDRALRQQSLLLAKQAEDNNEKGLYFEALSSALAGLPQPESSPDRPHVAEAEANLYQAVANLPERVLLGGHRQPVSSAVF